MKKISVLTIAFLAFGFVSKAQCDKKTKWTASKLEMVDTSGDVRTRDGGVTVTTGDGKISVIAENGEEEMNGNVTDYICEWQDKNHGKMSFKSELTDKEGRLRHATVTIESKDGKTIILLEAEEEQTKLRLPVDAFETVN